MADALSDAQIVEALENIDGWAQDGDKLVRTFEFDSYVEGLGFATAVGMICDGMNHHPDLMQVGYKKVILEFCTHDAGSKITQKDVDIAARINEALNK